MNAYSKCKGYAEKREFGMKLAVDPQAAFCKVVQSREVGVLNEHANVEGLMALWEVAKLEGLRYPEDRELLEAMVDGCTAYTHPKAALAAQGHKVYDYHKALAKVTTQKDSSSIALKKEPHSFSFHD